FALSGVLLASGIGVLKRKAWARKLGVIWSIVTISWTLVGQAISFAIILPMTMDVMEKTMGGSIPPESMGLVRAMSSVGGIVGRALGARPSGGDPGRPHAPDRSREAHGLISSSLERCGRCGPRSRVGSWSSRARSSRK